MKKNKTTALITGASRGIGKEIAKKLLKKGVYVIGTSTSTKGVKSIDKYLKKNGFGTVLNLKNIYSIEKQIQKIYENTQSIDILINNAGTKSDSVLLNMTNQSWQETINVNLTSVFYLTKFVLKNMIKNRKGRIITISSVIAFLGNIGQTNYSASKSGLIGFHKSLALEVASKGITVNVVAPGFIQTDFIKKLNSDAYQKHFSQIPVKRLGTVTDIANAVMFLSSDKSSYITGHTLHVNGGMYMV